MPAYTHESGQTAVTVPGSPLHRQMVAKAADPVSGWSLGPRPADPPDLDEVGDVDPLDVDVAGEP